MRLRLRPPSIVVLTPHTPSFVFFVLLLLTGTVLVKLLAHSFIGGASAPYIPLSMSVS
jgi:hypothetical protein